MGTESRDNKVELKETKFKPGPGAYASNYAPLVKKAPRYGFGSETRKEIGRTLVPGPGSYSAKEFVGRDTQGKSMSALTKWEPHMKEQAFKPGPGAYSDAKFQTMKKEPGWKMGSETRNDINFEKRKLF